MDILKAYLLSGATRLIATEFNSSLYYRRAALPREIKTFHADFPGDSLIRFILIIGITIRPSRTRHTLIGLLNVVLNPLGSAIAWWMMMGD